MNKKIIPITLVALLILSTTALAQTYPKLKRNVFKDLSQLTPYNETSNTTSISCILIEPNELLPYVSDTQCYQTIEQLPPIIDLGE